MTKEMDCFVANAPRNDNCLIISLLICIVKFLFFGFPLALTICASFRSFRSVAGMTEENGLLRRFATRNDGISKTLYFTISFVLPFFWIPACAGMTEEKNAITLLNDNGTIFAYKT